MAAVVLLWSASAMAEEPMLHPEPDHERIFTLSLENDIFSGEDDNYTNGVRASFLSSEDEIPYWLNNFANKLPFFAEEGRKRWHAEVGQSIFTPSDISIAAPQPNDRPYAGWLYGSVGAISDTGYRLDNLVLTVGMVGPSSLAGSTQKLVHRIVDDQDPQGWGNQLRDEPGIVLTYERKWRQLYEISPFGWGVDLTPSVGGSVGNIYTHALAGAVVRFGYDLPSDYGPPLIRPNLPGSDFFVPSKVFGWYLFAGIDGRAVARNVFLDGNSFRDGGPSVDKYPFVGGLQGGIAFTVDGVRIAYTHSFHTKEFEGQPENDAFGAVTVSWRF